MDDAEMAENAAAADVDASNSRRAICWWASKSWRWSVCIRSIPFRFCSASGADVAADDVDGNAPLEVGVVFVFLFFCGTTEDVL